jgi:hypothetical protein
MRVISFSCKDKLIAEHYKQVFGDQFAWELENHPPADAPALTAMIAGWTSQMLEEAKRQEHYDYYVHDDGTRELLKDDLGAPYLLIPEVVVSGA